MSDYIQQQDHNKAVYLREYSRWTGKMSSSKKRKLKAAGVEHPSASEVGNRNEKCVSEMSIASESPDIARCIDTMLDSWMELTYKMSKEDAVKYIYKLHCDMMDRAENIKRALLLERLVRFLLRESNPGLAAIGIAFAAGLDSVNGRSMTEIAIARCCTRAAISKTANRACDALQLPRSRYMKSAGARDVYRDRAKEIHRKQKGELR